MPAPPIRSSSVLFHGPISFTTPGGGEVTIQLESSASDYSITLPKPSGNAGRAMVSTVDGFTEASHGPVLVGTDQTISGTKTFTTLPVFPAGVAATEHYVNNQVFPISRGGTGAQNAADARTNLGLSTPLSPTIGGTGQTSLEAAITAFRVPYRFYESNSNNRTLSASDNGGLFRAQTGGGNVRYTLPPSANVTDGWTATFVKAVAANNLQLRGAGSDTIGGISGDVNIPNQYASITIIRAGNNWFATSYFAGGLLTP